MSEKTHIAAPDDKVKSDLVWGGRAISRELDRTLPQFYHLFSTGVLDGVVAKLGHKTFVASRRALQNLPFRQGEARRALETRREESRKTVVAAPRASPDIS
jgi:hypothetical protein